MSLFRRALVCFFVALSAMARAQVFERITIRHARSPDPRSMRLRVLPDGELVAHAVLVVDLISYAYDVPSNPSTRLNALPDWTHGDRYDIEANASPNAIKTTFQDAEIQLRVKQMIRRLLADRFDLLMRIDRRRMPASAMTVASGGARLQRAAITAKDCVFDTAPERCHTFLVGFGHPLNGSAIHMNDLIRYLENWTDRPPVNRTDLSDLFTMRTGGWLPMRLPAPPPNRSGHVDFSRLYRSRQPWFRTASARGGFAGLHDRTH